MSRDIQPGTYEAKIVNYGLEINKKGNPQVVILFEYQDGDQDRHEITWFGALTEKAKPYTLKALVTCGMKGNDLSKLAEGVEGGVLESESPVELAVAKETYNGKTYMKVQWINRIGGKVFRDKMSREDAKAALSALHLEGDLAQMRQEMGYGDQGATQKPAGKKVAEKVAVNHDHDDDDVGF